MKFMITFNHVEGVWEALSPQERDAHSAWLMKFIADLRSEKNAELVFLDPPSERMTIRKFPDGELRVVDGPAIQSEEQPGGYYLIEADSIDEAVDWAKRGRWLTGANEVMRVHSLPGDGDSEGD